MRRLRHSPNPLCSEVGREWGKVCYEISRYLLSVPHGNLSITGHSGLHGPPAIQARRPTHTLIDCRSRVVDGLTPNPVSHTVTPIDRVYCQEPETITTLQEAAQRGMLTSATRRDEMGYTEPVLSCNLYCLRAGEMGYTEYSSCKISEHGNVFRPYDYVLEMVHSFLLAFYILMLPSNL
jgi:hypothetical protein